MIDPYELGQPRPAKDAWLVSTWKIPYHETTYHAGQVRRDARGGVDLVMERASDGVFVSGEIQSDATITTGTLRWDARIADLPSGTVQGLFAFQSDWRAPRWEFDFEWTGRMGNRVVQIVAHATDPETGQRISASNDVRYNLGFDATLAHHRYEVVLTGKEAVMRVDGQAVHWFTAEDFGGHWSRSPVRSYVNLWGSDSPRWAGSWNGLPGGRVTANIRDADVRPGDVPVRIWNGTAGDNMMTAGSADNILRGGNGNDVLLGEGGNDLLRGGAGRDILKGGDGQDSLAGGTGNDALRSGAGKDDLRGGAGFDAFVFRDRHDAGDRILDWERADTIRFDDAGWGVNLREGALDPRHFALDVARDADDRFVFQASNATLWFDANGSAAGGLTLIADAQAGAVIRADDVWIA